MKELSRRRFLFASSGAAAGAFAVTGLAALPEAGGFDKSGLVTGAPKPLRFKSIPGFLSTEQIAPHHKAHYGGALKGYIAADKRISLGIAGKSAIEPAAYGALERARTGKGNSVLLHELYFDELSRKADKPGSAVLRAIEARFGSFERWADDFRASANAANGWAMLAFHPVNGKLYNLVSDSHAMGVLWMATPLVVIDVYEHAFYVDYKNRKTEYVAKFVDHIDWRVVGQRFREAS